MMMSPACDTHVHGNMHSAAFIVPTKPFKPSPAQPVARSCSQ